MSQSRRDFEARLEQAKVLYRADRFAEATEKLRTILKVGEAAWGPDSPEILDALTWLAMAISEKEFDRTLPEELALHERALRIVEQTFGPGHLKTAGALHDVALNHWGLGDLETARSEAARALAIAERQLDDSDWRMHELLGSLGNLLLEMHRPSEALPILEREARIADARNHDASRLIAHHGLGMALLGVGRRSEAAGSFAIAIEMAERKGGLGL